MTKYVCSACSATFSAAESARPPKCRECGSPATRRFTAQAAAEEVDALPADAEEVASGDELTEEVGRPAASPRSRRAGRRHSHAAATKAKTPPVAAFVGIGATLIAVVAVFIATSGGSKDDKNEGSAPATESAAATPSTPPASPAEDLSQRRAKLAAGDLAGRKELIAFAKEHELNDARLALLREVLLLDSEDADARKALGFTKHDTSGSHYAGRWLSKTDAELAAAYDKAAGKGAP